MNDEVTSPETSAAIVAVDPLRAVPPPALRATAVSQRMTQLDEWMRYANIFAASGLFKGIAGEQKRAAAQCAVKVIAGAELGIPPMAAMRSVYVFDGQVALAGPLILALIKKSGRYKADVDEESNDQWARITFFENVGAAADGRIIWERLGAVKWTIEMAKRAGLLTKDNWRNYPDSMLVWRCASVGGKRYTPDVFNGGVSLPEEINEHLQTDAEGNPSGEVVVGAQGAEVLASDHPRYAEVSALQTQLKWTRAMLALALRKAGGDIDVLIANMEADIEKQRIDRTKGAGETGTVVPPADAPAAGPPDLAAIFPGANQAAGSMKPGGRNALFAALSELGIKAKADRIAFAADNGIAIGSYSELSEAGCLWLSRRANERIAARSAAPAQATGNLVTDSFCGECRAEHGQPHAAGCPNDEPPEPVDDGTWPEHPGGQLFA